MHESFTFLIKGILLNFIVAILINESVCAQSDQPSSLIPYFKGNLWGYADRNRNIVIQPQFESASLFYGTVAKVQQNQKWALINTKGKLLTEPKYTNINFYTRNIGFQDGYRSGLLDTAGNEIINQNDRTYYLDPEGKKADPQPLISAKHFRNGIAAVQVYVKTGNRTTLMDKNGKDLLPPEFEFQDTIAVNNTLYYIIRTLPKYYYDENNQLSIKESALRFGLLNQKFETIIPVKFHSVAGENNFVFVRDWFGKAGFWNLEKRKKLTRRRFDKIETASHPARAIVSSLNKQGLLNSTGKWVIPLAKHGIQLESKYKTTYPQFIKLGINTPYLFYQYASNGKIARDPYGKELPAFRYGTLEKVTDSLILVNLDPVNKKKKENDEEDYYSEYKVNRFGLMNFKGEIITTQIYRNFQNRPENNLVILTSDSLVSYFTQSGEKLADRLIVNSYLRRNLPTQPETDLVLPQDLVVDNKKSCFHIQQNLPGNYKIIGNSCQFLAKAYGVIDHAGKVTIPFHFNEIYPASGNKLIVRQADKWGIINSKGTIILPVIYDKIIPLEGGNFITGIYAVLEEIRMEGTDNKMYYQLRDSTGRVSSDEVLMAAPAFKGNYAWVLVAGGSIKMDRTGKFITRVNHDRNRFNEVQPGIYQVTLGSSWEYIDLSGKTVIPPQFNQISKFSEGLAAVEKNGKWGYIDKKGRVIIPFKFDQALPFSNGKAFVRNLNDFRLVDKKGNFLSSQTYQDVLPFSEGLAAVMRNKKWGFIDEKEKLVIPFKYTEVTSFENGMATYSFNRWQGYLNKKGVQIVPPKYYNLQPFQKNTGWMEKYGKWYLANRQGQIIDSATTKPFKDKHEPGIAYWEDERLRVNNNHQLIFIKPDGTSKIIGSFKEFQSLSEGLIGIRRRSGTWYYIDDNGNQFYDK